jgi:hypothetical protein
MLQVTFRIFTALLVLLAWNTSIPAEISLPLLKNIRFVKTIDNKEKVFFFLNGYYFPEILSTEEKGLRLILNFPGMQAEKDTTQSLKTDGDFIKHIQAFFVPSPGPTTTVVIDLAPGQSYHIQQKFYEREKAFVLIIGPE